MSRVRGARVLRRKLQNIDPEVTRGVREAMEAGAETVRQAAIRLVPRDTGNLARILAEPRAVGRKSGGFKTEVGFRTKRQRRDGWYAGFVEFGTKGSPGGRRRRRIPPRRAQPFLRPALELSRPRIRKAIEREIRRALARAARGGAGVARRRSARRAGG